MYPLFIILFLIIFAIITWRNLALGLAILFSLLPTYLIRFHLGPFPTTFLEMLVWISVVVWFIQKIKMLGWRGMIAEKINYIKKWPALAMTISLFLIGATINVFLAADIRVALGEWRAFYMEPILISYILITTLKTKKEIHTILFGLILCGLITATLAIYQHFTGWLVPHSFWANRNTYRITAWYGFPNSVGLFLAPLFPLSFYLIKNLKNTILKMIPILYIPCGALAILFAKSTGAIIGLFGGLGLYLFLNKKTRLLTIVAVLIAVIGIILLPNSNPIKQEILAQDYSGKLRRDMWSETIQYLKLHPVRGTGMASYEEEIAPFRHDKTIEIFHHPHNILLTMWVNTGLVGLLGFVGILFLFFWNMFKDRTQFSCFLMVSMTIWLVMGLVDSPYIKNDLALLFWLIVALGYGEFSTSTNTAIIKNKILNLLPVDSQTGLPTKSGSLSHTGPRQ